MATKRAKAKRTKAATSDVSVPTYAKDHEVHAARAMHGASYDRLVAAGKIIAPTRDELSDTELAARIAKAEQKRAAKNTSSRRGGGKRPARTASNRAAKSASKRDAASESAASSTTE